MRLPPCGPNGSKARRRRLRAPSSSSPFYSEQAAAALAQTEDVRAFVSDLLKGIESLDLYLGKDVEVQTVREGRRNSRDVPLTFVQRKLLADEELAVWADVDRRFDHASDDQFWRRCARMTAWWSRSSPPSDACW